MENIHIIRQQHNLTVSEPRPEYHLPVASAEVLGGIKVGNNLAIDDEGVLSAYPSEYDLPTASSSTLGGVKIGTGITISNSGKISVDVDNALSSVSENPVQNKIVQSNLNSIDNSLSDLDDRLDTVELNISTIGDTISSHTSSISDINGDISILESSVSQNTDDITTNTNNISTLNTNLTSLGNTVDTLSTTVTNQGNSIDTLAGQVSNLIINNDDTIEYSYLLPVNVWSDGAVTLSTRGIVGIVNINLTGTLTLAAGTSTQVYQLPNTFQNTTISYGTLVTDDGVIGVSIDADRNLKFSNLTSSSMNITEVKGQIIVGLV